MQGKHPSHSPTLALLRAPAALARESKFALPALDSNGRAIFSILGSSFDHSALKVRTNICIRVICLGCAWAQGRSRYNMQGQAVLVRFRARNDWVHCALQVQRSRHVQPDWNVYLLFWCAILARSSPPNTLAYFLQSIPVRKTLPYFS